MIKVSLSSVLLLTITFLATACSNVKSDEEMVGFFQHRKTQFNKLINNIDSCKYREPDLIYIDNNKEQSAWCHKLLDSIQMRKVSKETDKNTGATSFYFYPNWLRLGSTYEKKYFYSERPPKFSPILTSIDNNLNDIPAYQPAYMHIEGNWYIYYVNLNG